MACRFKLMECVWDIFRGRGLIEQYGKFMAGGEIFCRRKRLVGNAICFTVEVSIKLSLPVVVINLQKN